MAGFRSLTSLGAAVLAAGLLAGTPAAPAVPTAPDSDAQGYLNSTARCASPATAVVFGSTKSSRVAICELANGNYEYRGVRLSDGAKLTVPATASDAGYVAGDDGITYTVSAKSLAVRAGGRVIRDEPMLDFHGAPAPAEEDPADQASAEEAPADTPAEAPAESPAPSTPLPPPLAAEEGHARS